MDASPYYIRMRVPAWLFGSGASPVTIVCRACGGRICNAIERSLERRRRARLPLSGTVLLQKRNMKRNRRTEGMSGGQSKE